jgi:hypothetical protein
LFSCPEAEKEINNFKPNMCEGDENCVKKIDAVVTSAWGIDFNSIYSDTPDPDSYYRNLASASLKSADDGISGQI